MSKSDQDPDTHVSEMVRLPGAGPRSTLKGPKLEMFDSSDLHRSDLYGLVT
jgi:hypothetical protein